MSGESSAEMAWYFLAGLALFVAIMVGAVHMSLRRRRRAPRESAPEARDRRDDGT